MNDLIIGCLILFCTMLISCQETQPKDQEVTKEVVVVDSTREDSLETKVANRDTVEIDETAVPYVSLLAQRDQIANEALIASLIEEGAKEIMHTGIENSSSSLYAVPPVAYDQLSLFAYLEDLLRLAHYQSQAAVVQATPRKKISWSNPRGMTEPDHQTLAYPLVRKEYLSKYCPGCLNPAYLALGNKELGPTQVQHPRYQPLLEMYTLIFDDQSRRNLYKNQLAFGYEEVSTQDSRRNTQSRAAAELAYQFNERAREEVNTEQEEQAKRMQQLFAEIKQAWQQEDVRVLEKNLNEILKLQEELITPQPIQNDIVRFFETEQAGKPFPGSVKRKARRLASYQAVPVSNDERVLAGAALIFARKVLQEVPLATEEQQQLQKSLEEAREKIASLKTEQETLATQLAQHGTILTSEEQSFFAAYQQSFQYHLNVWKRFAQQVQELLDVPAQESSFSYLILLDHALKERDKALVNNPLLAGAKEKIRKLRTAYYREVQEKNESLAKELSALTEDIE